VLRLLALVIALLVGAVALPSAAGAQAPAEDPTADQQWIEDELADEEDGDWVYDEEVSDPVAPAPATVPPPPAPAAPPAPPEPPAQPVPPALPPLVTRRTVPGKLARLRTDGKAAIPRQAPRAVKDIIAAANQIVGKPYKWGGGHARLIDRGYDCSGAVSYALIRAGLLASPLVSGGLTTYGERDAGRHVSVYANKGHVYMEVAGLRLDTSPFADPTGAKGPRWRVAIGRRAGFHARHPLGL